MVASPAITDAERRWLRVLGTLNEYQARLFVTHRALELGRGGISQLSQLTGMSRSTITRGIAALRGRASLIGSPGRGFLHDASEVPPDRRLHHPPSSAAHSRAAESVPRPRA
jgi:hypothetical protein